jgi:deoxyribodipyrimidine photolyase-related protein
MSDYCRNCRYDVTKRTGEDACPFNALYWDFLVRHRDKLGGNRRLAMPYRTWDRQPEESRQATLAQAASTLAGIDAEGGGAY